MISSVTKLIKIIYKWDFLANFFLRANLIFKQVCKINSLSWPNFQTKSRCKQIRCVCVCVSVKERSSSGRIYFWQIIGFSEQVNSITTALTSHIAADWLLLPLLRNNSCDAASWQRERKRRQYSEWSLIIHSHTQTTDIGYHHPTSFAASFFFLTFQVERKEFLCNNYSDIFV